MQAGLTAIDKLMRRSSCEPLRLPQIYVFENYLQKINKKNRCRALELNGALAVAVVERPWVSPSAFCLCLPPLLEPPGFLFAIEINAK